MEQRYSLKMSGGSLQTWEEGARAVFDCNLSDDGRGLYKAYIKGMGGRFLLGTLMPEGGQLRLRRTVSLDELKKKQLWPPMGAEAELAFPFGQGMQRAAPQLPSGWRREGDPARLMGDHLLAQAAGRVGGALFLGEEEGFALALPWDHGAEFPLAALFCFAHVERLGERWYAVFHFNRCGCPVFPNKGSGTGNTEGVKLVKE